MSIFRWLMFGSRGEKAAAPSAPTPLMLARGRGFTVEIVGESHYQETLGKIAGGKCEAGCKLEVVAQLRFEDTNAHDRDAIVVLIGGKPIGYIPRAVCGTMRAEILKLNPQERPITCAAKIVGGWLTDDDEGSYGVKLSLSKPLRSA